MGKFNWDNRKAGLVLKNIFIPVKDAETTARHEAAKSIANAMSKQYPYFKTISNLFRFLMLASVTLSVWAVLIYERTFMPDYILVLICLIADCCITPLLKNTLNIYIINPYNQGHLPIFFHVFYNVVTWSGLVFFLLMWTNETFANHQPFIISTNIVSSGYSKNNIGCPIPYVLINYHNQEKKLSFPCDTHVESFKTVYIKLEKGLLGYDVIKSYSLNANQF